MGKVSLDGINDGFIGSVVIEPFDGDYPEPIFWSKACRQCGIDSEMQPFVDGSKELVRVRFTNVSCEVYRQIKDRAFFLREREQDGLPTEPLPSGRWPDSFDEFADQVCVSVAKDDAKKMVYIDFNRAIEAIGISPSIARTIAALLMDAAGSVDPDGDMSSEAIKLLNVTRVKVPGYDTEQEGIVEIPSILSQLSVSKESKDE